VRRALAKDPAQRFASGRELLQALDQCVVAPPGAARLGRSRPLRTAAMALGGLGVATAAALWIRGQAGGAAAALPSGAVAHVLWVDDNPENNGEVIRQLERRGVQVTTALSTADALQRFDPAVHHLVVSDMGRFEGVMNTYVERAGLELIRGLQARSGEVKLMYCTSARAVASYRVEALEAGALAIVEDCGQVLRVAGLR
jgi:CheY-like chemotaxis protein